MRLSRRFSPLILAGFTSCAPLFDRPYGTSVHYARECGPVLCHSAAMLRTVREVQEGDLIEGARLWSSVAYRGWIISRIGADGVELRPSENSLESVHVPYNDQVSVENLSPVRYNFESSLLFEEGPRPGTAVMTVLEK
jgi:hypothetical protein